MFLRNVGWTSTEFTALYPRRQNSSQPPLREPQIKKSCFSLRIYSNTTPWIVIALVHFPLSLPQYCETY
jgi:hypothetical protein